MANSKGKTGRDALIKALNTDEAKKYIQELKDNQPPLEILAKEEVETIEKAGRILAAKAESYYLGYLKGQASAGGEVADAGVTIVAATAGSAVGTVVGQIVGKKMGGAINIHEQIINPEMFQIGNIGEKFE